MNKILVEQNELYLQEEDVFVELLSNTLDLFVKGNVYCGLFDFTNKHLCLHLEKNSHLTLEFFLTVSNAYNEITIYNEENSQLDLHYACTFKGENELIITNVLRSSHNKNHILIRAVEDDGSLVVKAKGEIEKETEDNIYLEDIKALIQNNNRVKVMPDLLVNTDFVSAVHNATISPVDENALFYLESKGIDKNVATSLLKEGFLKEIIEKEELKN